MAIRGVRNVFPKKGRPPTGIFSSKGSQKRDSTDHFQHQSDQNYAHGSGTRSKPKSTSKPMHQPPRTYKQQAGTR